MATAEWTVLEKLLLSQAVYKYGEDNWFQIARNLKHHALLDRPSDYFNQKNCSLQYYLMVEDLEKSKRHALTQDMPVVVQIARQLYSLRLEELKRAINEDEEKFLLLISEIDDIRAGKWDNQLLGLPKDQPSTIAAVESNTNIPLKTEEISNSDQQSADEFQTDESKQEKISEEQAKVQTDNLQNETRNVRDKDTTPPPREETPTASDESFQSAIEDTESQAKKRPAEEVDDEEEPSLKRQKTDLDESIRNDYSTDVSQVTTPADTTDLRDGTESIAGSDSNATSEYKRSHKRDDPRHKSWQKNINLLWREIANHKNGAMFMNPIKESIAPHYYEIIKRPMDLKTIKNRIRDGLITSTVEFERDVVLMLNNSLMYNKEGTEVYLLAREMLQDTEEKIKIFKNADTDTAASSHTRAAAKERRKSIAPE